MNRVSGAEVVRLLELDGRDDLGGGKGDGKLATRTSATPAAPVRPG